VHVVGVAIVEPWMMALMNEPHWHGRKSNVSHLGRLHNRITNYCAIPRFL
jgi:hypothetical protein